MISFILLVSLLACTAAYDGSLYNVYETPANIRRDGFPVEVHHVTTSDGYILELHRIPHGRGQVYSAERPVVLMVHGLLAASNSYLLLGPNFAPAYNLADGGFDVWLANAKGTRNSRFHVTLDPDDDKMEFFDFSWEEIATTDLPAIIDYALEVTGRPQLHYIGHSQGGTVFFVLNSMLPQYNEKIASAHLLAGVGYQNYFPSSELGTLALATTVIYNSALLLGQVELFGPNFTLPITGSKADLCFGNIMYKSLCDQVGIKYLLNERDSGSDLGDLQSALENYDPAGAALKQLAHYGQNIRDKSFARWSYGSILNRIVYGTSYAPPYDLSLITVKTTMHYTISDMVLDERDVMAMASVMQNAVARKVPKETFTHTDFVGSTDVKELVTDYIIEALKVESGLIQKDLDN